MRHRACVERCLSPVRLPIRRPSHLHPRPCPRLPPRPMSSCFVSESMNRSVSARLFCLQVPLVMFSPCICSRRTYIHLRLPLSPHTAFSSYRYVLCWCPASDTYESFLSDSWHQHGATVKPPRCRPISLIFSCHPSDEVSPKTRSSCCHSSAAPSLLKNLKLCLCPRSAVICFCPAFFL